MKRNISIIPKIVFSDPGLAFYVARSFLYRFKAGMIDYNFYNGKTKVIALVSLMITPRCNLHCHMCAQYGDKGHLKGDSGRTEEKTIVPVSRYIEIVDELMENKQKPVFYFWGGEPFMYPGFLDLAQYITSKCPAFSVSTNGTFITKYAKRIVKDKWGSVLISLDGVEEINDKVRGKNTYKKVIEGIKAINREKYLQNSSLPHVGVVSVVSNLNYRFLDKLVYELKDYKLSWHAINFGTYMTEEIGKSRDSFMKKHFNINAYYWRGYDSKYNEGIDGEEFLAVLKRIKKIKLNYPIITIPVIKSKAIRQYHSQLGSIIKYKCQIPWFFVCINYNGDVIFCTDHPEYVIGNIKEDNFFDIYNNEKAVKYRQILKKADKGIWPGCTRCYSLMFFGNRKKILA